MGGWVGGGVVENTQKSRIYHYSELQLVFDIAYYSRWQGYVAPYKFGPSELLDSSSCICLNQGTRRPLTSG